MDLTRPKEVVMKKVGTLALLCIPLCLLLGFGAIQPSGGDGQQQQQAQVQPYFLESEYYSMEEFGKFLEKMGREIQQNGSFVVDGETYPMSDYGSVELSVGANGGIGFEVRGGITEPPTRGPTYNAYIRNFRSTTPERPAAYLAKIGETLGSTGAFVIDNHRVALEGTARVTQRVLKEKDGPEGQFGLKFDMVFGPGEFPVPTDELDMVQEEKSGDIVEQASEEVTGANAARLARLFGSLSRDMRAGRVRVEGKDFTLGENFRFSISHMVATDGQSQRVSVEIREPGQVQPRQRQPTDFSDEVWDLPAEEIAKLLKRIGTEILEDGTITFDGVAYRAGVSGGYELGVGNGRFGIELNISTPPPN